MIIQVEAELSDGWLEDCPKSTIHIVPKAWFQHIKLMTGWRDIQGDAQIPTYLIPYYGESHRCHPSYLGQYRYDNYAKLLNNEIRILEIVTSKGYIDHICLRYQKNFNLLISHSLLNLLTAWFCYIVLKTSLQKQVKIKCTTDYKQRIANV